MPHLQITLGMCLVVAMVKTEATYGGGDDQGYDGGDQEHTH